MDTDSSSILDNLADESTEPPCEANCIKLEPSLKLSPPSTSKSPNSSLKMVDNGMLTPRKKSKKGPAPKLFGNEKCKICDSRATGFHYNVLSCEACKVIIHALHLSIFYQTQQPVPLYFFRRLTVNLFTPFSRAKQSPN